MNSEANRKLKVCMGVVLLIAMVILSARLALYEKEKVVPVSSGVAEIAPSLQKRTIVIDAGHGGNEESLEFSYILTQKKKGYKKAFRCILQTDGESD